MSKYMNRYTKLCDLYDRINNDLHENKYNVIILINTEENHLSAIYGGHRVCKIKDCYNNGTYNVEFEDGFFDKSYLPSIKCCHDTGMVVYHIERRIAYYNFIKKGQKNMTNKRFIVEDMEVKMNNFGPDVINMTIRKDPDGLVPGTGKKLKALIESLDPDKLSSDYRINVNVDNNTVEKQIYMMSARGSGKTRWVSEQLKNAWPCKNNIKDNIKDVIFNDPATIVFWVDGSKTVVKCQKGETFDPEKGLAMAISKKVLGNDYGYYETFAKHVGRYNKKRFNKALEEAKKVTPDEVVYNGRTYKLTDEYTVKSKEE